MKFYVIQSGSKGNATIVENDGRILLIDMGISLLSLKCALEKIGKKPIDIEALLLTHEHSDHTKGIKYMDPLPIYTLDGTYEGTNVETIEPYKPFEIIGLNITPVSTSHDVINPCGFVIKNHCETLIYLTDSGIIPCKTLTFLKNADYYVFESNHDEKMLWNSNRPYLLKKRIYSEKGHLSNNQSAEYLADLIGDKTKQIILAHLSEECNSPRLAIRTHKKIYKDRKIKMKNVKLICASQHKMVEGGAK